MILNLINHYKLLKGTFFSSEASSASEFSLFETSRETIASHIVKKYQDRANEAGLNVSNFELKVLCAVSSDSLASNDKFKSVLGLSELKGSTSKHQLYVCPRFGTFSPWGSETTQILESVGIKNQGRVERVLCFSFDSVEENPISKLGDSWHDKMTESLVKKEELEKLFDLGESGEVEVIDILGKGIEAVREWNARVGACLREDFIKHLAECAIEKGKNPTDVYLFAFATANSEHCKHNIFTDKHTINGKKQDTSLFRRIKNTHKENPNRVLGAYKDNAAVIGGSIGNILVTDENGKVHKKTVDLHGTLKVETHNHPTAISAFPGAATGSGGEIRDEGAVGAGSQTATGLASFFVSNTDDEHLMDILPGRETPLSIMTDGPLGAAAYNNQFGRPSSLGCYRSFEQEIDGTVFGYHKPVMGAGGIGTVLTNNIKKRPLPPGTLMIQIGGPSMRIGVGGGSGSSVNAGAQDNELDFASVQRANPEIERRCQEVINFCSLQEALGKKNIILAVHDVGAGGSGNSAQELVYDSTFGANLYLDKLPCSDPSLTPLEQWSNESQEKYMVSIHPDDLSEFRKVCEKENCPMAVFGEIVPGRQLTLSNSKTGEVYIDEDLEVMLGRNVALELEDSSVKIDGGEINLDSMEIEDSLNRVLKNPAVGDKTFLVTIGDRTVGGKDIQNQMVGSWQVPVSNASVSLHGIEGLIGDVMTMGEKSPIAVINPAASVRMAIGEMMTNLCSASIEDLESIAVSGNWMAASSHPGQLVALEEGVKAAEKLSVDLGIVIPVGKDSLSMKTMGNDGEFVVSPLTFLATARAETLDVYKTLTPELKKVDNSELILVDLGAGKNRLGASILAQSFKQFGNNTPDVDDSELLLGFVNAMRELHQKGLVLAYHDRSDGGLVTTLAEMSFASHIGVEVDLSVLIDSENHEDIMKVLFSEELGAVLQIESKVKEDVLSVFENHGLEKLVSVIGKLSAKQNLVIKYEDKELLNKKRVDLQKVWSTESNKVRLKTGRDNPDTVKQEMERNMDEDEPAMPINVKYDLNTHPSVKIIEDYEKNNKQKPKVAALRAQGINGQDEMQRYFMRAGFEVYNVHVNDILSGKHKLEDFVGIVFPGGFSFQDVLGAGVGFSEVIKQNPEIAEQFKNYKGFVFGTCNGCQTVSKLKDILPGAAGLPDFVQNDSTAFEARLNCVEIADNPDSIFTRGMGGSILSIINSHGEGKAVGGNVSPFASFVDHRGNKTERYPLNPNGSANGATGFETDKVCIIMGHPEREPSPTSPWLQVVYNLRESVENNSI